MEDFGLTGAVPAEIGRLSALRVLNLGHNQLTSIAGGDRAAHVADGVVPQRQSADESAGGDRAAHVADVVDLSGNQLTSVPAEIGQLTSLRVVPRRQSADERAGGDRAAHVADGVEPQRQSADELAGGDRAAHLAEGVVPRLQSADERAGGDRAAHVAGELNLDYNQLTSLPAEIGQLTSLKRLNLSGNQLTSVPAEIGQLTALRSCTSTAIS